MEYEISEYRFMIRELSLIPGDAEQCDLVLLRPQIPELRAEGYFLDRLRLEAYRVLFGKIFYDDREYFSEQAVFSLTPLLNDDEEALQCRDIAGLEEVKLVQCKFRTATGETMALHGQDTIRLIQKMKQTLLVGSEIISAKFRVRIKTMGKEQILKIKRGNRAEFPYRWEKIIEAWLMARGFKHGCK